MSERFINWISGGAIAWNVGFSIEVMIDKATPIITFIGLCTGVALTILMIFVQLRKYKNEKRKR